MSLINEAMNVLFNVLLFPFQYFAPLVGLTALSILLGVAFLLLFKYTSPQNQIKKFKDRIKAGLYEVRLYKDELGVVFSANKELLKNNGLYISCCFVPLAPMILLILPILVQFDTRYGISPLEAGDTTVLKIVLSDQVDFDSAKVDVQPSPGLKISAGPVRIPAKKEFNYRLEVEKEGQYDLMIAVNGQSYTKSIDAEAGMTMVSPIRMKSCIDSFVYPKEKPFPADAQIESVEVKHGRKAMLGMDGDYFPWLIIFCVVALVAGFGMKGVFNVNI